MKDWTGTFFILCLYLFIPIFLAKVPIGASWKAILIAYGVWIGLLLAFGFSSSKTIGEALGWPMILGMFFTIPAIPAIVFLLRLWGVR